GLVPRTSRCRRGLRRDRGRDAGRAFVADRRRPCRVRTLRRVDRLLRGRPQVHAPPARTCSRYSADTQFILTLRVRDLDALLRGLEAAGVEIATKPDWDDPSVGRFARIHDLE